MRLGVDLATRRDAVVRLNDPGFYHLQANLLAAGKGYVDPFLALLHHPAVFRPSAAHPPLFSTYLALWSWLGLDSLMAHRVAAAVAGTAACLVIVLVGRRIAGPRVGWIAGGLAAISPSLWLNDVILNSESIYALTVAVVLLLAYRYWSNPTLPNAAGLGVAIAFATYGRAEAIILVVAVAVPIMITRAARRWRDLALCAAVLIVVLAPWLTYNLVRFREPTFMTTTLGAALQVGYCRDTFYGNVNELGYWSNRCYVGRPIPATKDESEGDQILRREALGYLRDHAGRLPVVVGVRLARLLDLYRPLDAPQFYAYVEDRPVWAGWIAQIQFYLFVPLGIAGLVVLRRRRVAIAPLVGTGASVVFLALVLYPIPRFRVALDIALLLAGAVALDRLLGGDGSGAAPGPPEEHAIEATIIDETSTSDGP